MGRKQPVAAPLVALLQLSDQDVVGRSYFDIRAGPSHLFSEKPSQLLAKSSGHSPAPQ